MGGTIHTRQLEPYYFRSCDTFSADDSRWYPSDRIVRTVWLEMSLLTEIQLSQKVHDPTISRYQNMYRVSRKQLYNLQGI